MSVFDLIPAFFVPQRAIATFQAKVTIEEVCSDDLEITEHPVGQGASITDHAYVKPSTVAMSVVFTRGQAPLNETYNNLLALQATREPFTVITGKRAYNNMLMKSLTVVNSLETENILSVRMLLQEIFIVALETSTVSQPSNQANAATTQSTQSAGQKSALPVDNSTDESVNRSILREIAG